jgi:peptide/nickel transport system ATP-binding protein
MPALLRIDALSVDLRTRAGPLRALDAIGLEVAKGETVCLVGESGSGKTLTALSVIRLVDHAGGRIAAGSIGLGRHDLAQLSQAQMSSLRGRRIGIVFQDPMTAFDPLFTIGAQIAEVLTRHGKAGPKAARQRALDLLKRVRISDAELRLDQYPHELSGGMRQRAMIAMALACDPALLIADEPTTALDVTIQAQVLALLKELQAESGMAILLITHDLGVAAQIADRVVVMYAGRIVENGRAAHIFARPAHPYTRGLLGAVVGGATPRGAPLPAIPGAIPMLGEQPEGCRFHPRCAHASGECRLSAPPLRHDGIRDLACWHPQEGRVIAAPPPAVRAGPAEKAARAQGAALVRIADIHKHYLAGSLWSRGGRRTVRAVDGVSLDIAAGETFGLVGESGSGKSTLGRMILHLEKPTSGSVAFDGHVLGQLDRQALRGLRRDMQIVFQDPYGSIDSRWTIGRIVAEPLAVHGVARADIGPRVAELLDLVGLDRSLRTRYPHQLSGGQRQRVAIARAIALEPRFIVADEAVSALDVSVRAQVLNLLDEIKQRLGLTYLFIGHDLHIVRHVSDRIGVMYLGRLVEVGPAEEVFRRPAHPYTRSLLAAIPEPDPARRTAIAPLSGEVPSPSAMPRGCRFHTRCPVAIARCREDDPQLTPGAPAHLVACHRAA